MTTKAPSRPGNPHRLGRMLGTGFVVLVALALIGLLAYGMLAPRTTTGSVPVRVRDARDFTLPLHSGGTLQLSALRGTPVVLNFWASWCAPCKQEAPILEAVSRRYQGREVLFLGVNVWDKDEDAQAFLRQFNITYDSVIDASGNTAIDYGVSGIPETFFIDRDGKIRRHFVGPIGDQQLASFIDELLQ